MSQIFIQGGAKYVEISPGYCLVNGQILYISSAFSIADFEMVGAPGGDFGDYHIYLRPNRKVMEAYYSQNWEYVLKSTAPAGAVPSTAPDEIYLGFVQKRLDGSGITVLTAVEANRRPSGESSIRLVNSKDISDGAIQPIHIAPQQSWQTLTLGGGTWSPTTLAYFKDTIGMVHFRGDIIISPGSTIAATTTLGTLGSDYRPGVITRLDLSPALQIDISTGGVITNVSSITASSALSFGMCHYKAE